MSSLSAQGNAELPRDHALGVMQREDAEAYDAQQFEARHLITPRVGVHASDAGGDARPARGKLRKDPEPQGSGAALPGCKHRHNTYVVFFGQKVSSHVDSGTAAR